MDATSVYWANVGASGTMSAVILKAPLSGGTPVTLASGQAAPASIAIDATSVYWTNEGICPGTASCALGSVVKVSK